MIFSVGAEKRMLPENKLEKKKSVSITFKVCVNVAKCLFLMFSDKKVYNDPKFCNRNYFNQWEKKKTQKTQMSYMKNIATDVMLTGELDDR